jgi:hypothetical protein
MPSKKQPTPGERSALHTWLALAASKPGESVDQAILDELRRMARIITRLALERAPAKQAAATAAHVAGLSGRAFAALRAEQDALRTAAAFEFNRGQPRRDKASYLADTISAERGARQVYRQLKRSR